MKKILTIILIAFSIALTAQVNNFTTTALSASYKTSSDTWSDWSPWEYTSVPLIINTKEDRIIIMSNDVQVYDILYKKPTFYDKDGDRVLMMICADNMDIKCIVTLIVRNSFNGEGQIYIEYENIRWAYEIED